MSILKKIGTFLSAGTGISFSSGSRPEATPRQAHVDPEPLPQRHERIRALAMDSDPLRQRREVLQVLEGAREDLARELADALALIVGAHCRTLYTKMNQLIYRDPYGNEIYDKFIVERDYFIKNVMCRDVPSSTINFLFGPDSYPAVATRVFDESLSQYVKTKVPEALERDSSAMSPIEYEQYCADLLKATGWEVRLTKRTGDQGIDVVATLESIKIVGQCKLYSNPVGNSAVQEIIAGREFEKADYAFVVSNSSFTPAARTLASASGVLLMHDSQLCDLPKILNLAMPQRDSDTCAPAYESANPARKSGSRTLPEILTLAADLQRKYIAEGYEPHPQSGETVGADSMYDQAVAIVLQTRRPSISLVQRHLRIGYNQAARFIEQMERAGLVSPMQTNGNREVLVPPGTRR